MGLPASPPATRRPWPRTGFEKAPPSANYTLIRRDGLEIAIISSLACIRDLRGNAAGAVAVFHDVGAARAKSVELSHLAQHDFLTDLPNRLLLKDRINQAISFADRYNKQLSVMFVDLDHFKKINDSFATPWATSCCNP